MAVYTKITGEEIALHLQKYSLGPFIKFTEIIDGIDNSNFIIETEEGKFIFTIFEQRINKNDLPFFINLKLHLAQKNISCPRPIPDKSGFTIVDFKEKKSAIVSFLSGKTLQCSKDGFYLNTSQDHCFKVGEVLAKLHLAASDFKISRKNDLGINCFRSIFSKFENLIEGYQKNLHSELLENINLLEKSWRFDLPCTPCHLDLFPDNVFFDQNQNLSGIIDFYFSANDALIYDLAIAVNAWCFEKTNFNQEKFFKLMQGYEKIRKISKLEKSFLKTALIGASTRFLLTRLHDMFFTPKDSLVKIKNPQEYLEKLRFFKSTKFEF